MSACRPLAIDGAWRERACRFAESASSDRLHGEENNPRSRTFDTNGWRIGRTGRRQARESATGVPARWTHALSEPGAREYYPVMTCRWIGIIPLAAGPA